MAQRHQRGWLKKEKRAQGETWVLFFRTTRQSDGKRVEDKVPIGLVLHLPDASSACAQVERLHVPINRVDVRRGLIFGDLAQHYAEHEAAAASSRYRVKKPWPNRELSHAGWVGPDAVKTTRPSPLILFSSASTDSKERARVNLKRFCAHSARKATIERDEQPAARNARASFAERCQRD